MRPRTKLPLMAAALCAAAALCFALPAGASAARDAEVSIMDDQLLLGQPASQIEGAMRRFRWLGVDRLRVSAFWYAHAPAAESPGKPAGFDGSSHADPGYDWSALDPVVAAAARHGFKVLISLSTPGPLWASGDPSRGSKVYKPDVAEFAGFAHAVAMRYRHVADQIAIGNEPNFPSWLEPQVDGRGMVAPHHYRAMVHAAYPAIKLAHPGATVLIGELASRGRRTRSGRESLRPLRFLRAMACRDRKLRPLRSGRCRGFRPPPADAIGHHPYSFFDPPHVPSEHPDDAGIGDGARLVRLLNALTARRGIDVRRGRRLDVHYTEFGYQTDPPNPYGGILLGQQERWLQEAAYVVWKSPQVRGLNQFRLTDGEIRDEPGTRAFGEFQSGLLYEDLTRKPAYGSFAHPFAIVAGRPRAGQRVRFWGQVRRGTGHRVTIEFRRRRGQRFRAVKRLRTSRRGYFATRLPARSGLYRYRYNSPAPGGKTKELRLETR